MERGTSPLLHDSGSFIREMWPAISFSALVFASIFLSDEASALEEKRSNLTNIVLIGATGDLAKRYLWQGFFELYNHEEKEGNIISFYAAARDDVASGRKKIKEFLELSLKCDNFDRISCVNRMKAFVSVTRYHSLKDDKDYVSLCEEITNNIGSEIREQGRIFYLSVPPFAYGQIAKRINSFCRPQDRQTWVRVVFEKPFGFDISSALELSTILSRYFEEKEIYRIDHYLGKTGVAQILDFRFINNDLYKELWNSDHIEWVEIMLKETADCRERTNFYDKYGVIRDVMQNHMTELLVMVAMEVPSSLENTTNMAQNKLRLLKEIKPLNRWSGVVGQYRDYNKHYYKEDEVKRMHLQKSRTPTFAAVSLFVNNRRWHGVPFILVSGKQLDERAAYVRVIFKNNIHSMMFGSDSQDQCNIKQIVFNVQGGGVKSPAILISGPLPRPEAFTSLALAENSVERMFGCLENTFHAFIHNVSSDAYTTLISAVYREQRNLFVGTEDLLASWRVWSPLLESLDSVMPRLYDKENLNLLEFMTLGERLQYSQNDGQETCDMAGICEPSRKVDDSYKPGLFRGDLLETGHEEYVIKRLADNILHHALAAVSLRGVFHLALSGGTSPTGLYETLAFSVMEFPWQQTHIWMVDERCIPLNSKQSNFHSVFTALLQYVPISPFNVHSFYVNLEGGLCDPNDHGSQHYEAELRRTLDEGSLDFVVLGVGTDGHTASLFSAQGILNETQKWVSLSESNHSSGTKQRMTMTFSLLNSAKSIAVLVLGKQKHDIVRKISGLETDVWRYPITGIQPGRGKLVWYIDNRALHDFANNNGET